VRRMRVRASFSSPVNPASDRHFASDITTVGRVVRRRGGGRFMAVAVSTERR
jgi:hypothetical protein